MHTARGASRIFGFVRWQGHHLTLAQEPRHPQLYLMLLGPCAMHQPPPHCCGAFCGFYCRPALWLTGLESGAFLISKVSEREKCTPVAHPFALLLSHVSLISSSALCASNAPAAGCFVRRAESKGLNFLSLSLSQEVHLRHLLAWFDCGGDRDSPFSLLCGFFCVPFHLEHKFWFIFVACSNLKCRVSNIITCILSECTCWWRKFVKMFGSSAAI
jgi:hypothetical protein